jgi:diketogulonate reductase-like aldo/keto reductase
VTAGDGGPCSINVGMIPLTGTSNASHMQADLSVVDFELSPEEVLQINHVAG